MAHPPAGKNPGPIGMPCNPQGDSSQGRSSSPLLCLLCREIGHAMKSCPHSPRLQRGDQSIPSFIKTTRTIPPLNVRSTEIGGPKDALCPRCESLAVVLPISLNSHPMTIAHFAELRPETKAPILGPINSLQLLTTCPLCRIIFDITYLTEDGIFSVLDHSNIAQRSPSPMEEPSLLLLPAWTIHRLETLVCWQKSDEGQGPYAKCLSTAMVYFDHIDDGVSTDVDAVSFLDIPQKETEGIPALGVKQVDPRTPDYAMVKEWLRRCDVLHNATCRLPPLSEGLRKIKLVDVETRQIVMYPQEGCEYVALSYMWGPFRQPPYKLGDILPSLPATLEDAMVAIRHLGKRYLWADSLCIEQGNEAELAVQLGLMSDIYSGAWATIINLAGHSVHSGLPRVGTWEGLVPQLSYDIGGKRLVSLMPTLSEQISRSLWSTRAWTFQEGLLSPRRLFFTNHQVYFECNTLQCCESLYDSQSPFHTISDDERRSWLQDNKQLQPNEGSYTALGQGVLRDPFRPFEKSGLNFYEFNDREKEDPFEAYCDLLSKYTQRKMSQGTDSLSAFSAVFTRLERTLYRKGFLYGLPIEDFPWALLWYHITNARRREGFPEWSWSGWEGTVAHATEHASHSKAKEFRSPLRIWKVGESNRPELIYASNPTSWIEDARKTKNIDPGAQGDLVYLHQSSVEMFSKSPGLPQNIMHDELLIEGMVLQLTFTPLDHLSSSYYSPVDRDDTVDDSFGISCRTTIGGKATTLLFRGHDALKLLEERSGKEQQFLLLDGHTGGRHFPRGYVRFRSYMLLLIDWHGDTAKRVGVAVLEIEEAQQLADAKPNMMLVKLG